MSAERDDFAIVMRTFWPVSPVVGEGMMQVSENLSCDFQCRVITQDQQDVKFEAKRLNRGPRVLFSPIYAFSNSSSNMLVRLLDLIWFAVAVFFILILRRPRVVYVATDPPLLVPIVVAVYAKVLRAEYVYHVQDIHPEATAVVFPKFKQSFFRHVFEVLRLIDNWVVKNAFIVITLTVEMSDSLKARGGLKSFTVRYINNPSAALHNIDKESRYDFSFVGNAGRLQLIPLVLAAVRKYLIEGGTRKFAFAGAGVMSNELRKIAAEFPKNVSYFGKVPVDQATQITLSSEWALLPIDDEVCAYAFPSKASTYAVSGKPILAICGENTSVAKWINSNDLGVVVKPDLSELVDFFKRAERFNELTQWKHDQEREKVLDQLSTQQFVTGVVRSLRDAAKH